jgi:hypothetical protein
MSEENTSSSHNYALYAHIAELSVIAFSSFYFYRKCAALEERIAKLENVRVTETQEIDQTVVDAIAAHVYAQVLHKLEARPQRKVGSVAPSTGASAPQVVVEEEDDALPEYKGSDRDLETELKKEL